MSETDHTFDCRDVGGLLAAWVDGELMPEEKSDFDAHLLTCADCARAARSHLGLKQAVRRSSGERKAPEGLRSSVAASLALASHETPGGRAMRWASNLQPRTVALAASVAGVMTWFSLGGLTRPVLGHGAVQHVLDDGVALHTRGLPLDFAATDSGAVQSWLAGKLDYGVHLPRFPARSGARTPALQGVRLSTVSAHPAAVVSYTVPDAQQSKVSLLIVEDPAEEPAGVSRHIEGREVWLAKSRGFNVATWKNDEVVYSLISDLDEGDVLELVRVAELR